MLACVAANGCSNNGSSTDSVSADQHATFASIEWEALIPAEELENHKLAVAFAMRRVDHSTDERAAQFGSFKTVSALDGKRVELTGYLVPLDTDSGGQLSTFFLVPTMGACIHVPPPPPDQTVYVQLRQPISAPAIGAAASVHGTLHASTHDGEVASAAYTISDADVAVKERKTDT